MKLEEIARVCHQVNKAYCESQEDSSQEDWEDAPEWQRGSAIKGVQFHINNPEALPSDSHEEWLKVKKEEGWIYGKEKNEVLKIHPCFIPYNELSPEQKAKDYIFKAIIDSLK